VSWRGSGRPTTPSNQTWRGRRNRKRLQPQPRPEVSLNAVRRSVACSRCENPEDLESWGDQMLCRPCRICPHEIELHEGGTLEICYLCLRDLFTVGTFVGPRITNMYRYDRFAQSIGADLGKVEVHCFREWNDWIGSDALRRSAYARNQETGSATAGGRPVSPFERTDTSPCPPLHHLARGRTW